MSGTARSMNDIFPTGMNSGRGSSYSGSYSSTFYNEAGSYTLGYGQTYNQNVDFITGRTSNQGQGFNTFKELKQHLGSAGSGNYWHHIVEQSQIGKSGFSPNKIQNTNNAIAVEATKHYQITVYYNTTSYEFTKGLSVRNWLTDKAYQFQYDYGIGELRDKGVIK